MPDSVQKQVRSGYHCVPTTGTCDFPRETIHLGIKKEFPGSRWIAMIQLLSVSRSSFWSGVVARQESGQTVTASSFCSAVCVSPPCVACSGVFCLVEHFASAATNNKQGSPPHRQRQLRCSVPQPTTKARALRDGCGINESPPPISIPALPSPST